MAECDDVFGWIQLPKLSVGTHEYLFRCASCNRDSLTHPDATAEMLVEFAPSGAGPWTTFDRVKVDIRPLNQWLTVMSARPPGDMIFKPLATLIQPEPIPDDASPFANPAWPGTTQIPPLAKNVTVIVHGYNVSTEDAQTKFMPTYLKRLYWTGLPVLRRQGQWWKQDDAPGCVHECAHTVGISWPSNDSGESTVERFLDAVVPGFENLYASARYPFDEYHALGVGPSLKNYLTAVRDQRSDRSINVLAHSLGNMAVNSALYRLNRSGVIDKYVMNEAAFAAEALDLAYGPTDDELTIYGDHHAGTYGYPDDTIWKLGWAADSAKYGGIPRWQGKVDTMRQQGASSNITAEEMYTRRWEQLRAFPVPDSDQTNVSNRGPWNAYFGRNKTFTRIFNTYSENDRVVGMAWRTNQRMLKPFSLIGPLADKYIRDAINKAIRAVITKRLGLAAPEDEAALETKSFVEKLIPQVPELATHDNDVLLNWELTKWTDPEQATVFGAADHLHWTTLRQWAELSFWFPATSVGAGVKNLDQLLGSHCNLDVCVTNFTKYSLLGDGPVPATFYGPVKDAALYGYVFGYTHSYLGYGKFTDVWKAYGEIAKIFDPKN